jgi:hypothetical protein
MGDSVSSGFIPKKIQFLGPCLSPLESDAKPVLVIYRSWPRPKDEPPSLTLGISGGSPGIFLNAPFRQNVDKDASSQELRYAFAVING